MVGFIDAAYLTVKHYTGEPVSCSIINGCEEVTTSEYSIVFGIPLALIGAIYYAGVSALLFFYLEDGGGGVLRLLLLGVAGAFLVSLWLFYIQIAVIEELCLYCLVSAGSSTFLLAGVLALWKKDGSHSAIRGGRFE